MKNGFTLLEIIIATSIVAVIGVVFAQVLSSTTRSNTKVEILKEVKQNGDFALSLMNRMARNARRVTSTCSDTGSGGTSLAIENFDGATTTFGCQLDSGVTRIASTSGTQTDFLTGTNVTLGGTGCAGATLSFTCTSAGGSPVSVAIQFRLAQKSTSPLFFEQANELFQSTVALRNR